MRIADEHGATAAPGDTGEIRVSAADDRYRPMLGYWNRPEASAEALDQGWADLARCGQDVFAEMMEALLAETAALVPSENLVVVRMGFSPAVDDIRADQLVTELVGVLGE